MFELKVKCVYPFQIFFVRFIFGCEEGQVLLGAVRGTCVLMPGAPYIATECHHKWKDLQNITQSKRDIIKYKQDVRRVSSNFHP